MLEQSNRGLAIGPYSINMCRPIAEPGNSAGYHRFECFKDSLKLTAKCVSRDLIGAAAKRKGYQKWNAQIKVVTQVNHPNVLQTKEVLRTSSSYWFFQLYESACTKSVAEFLRLELASGP